LGRFNWFGIDWANRGGLGDWGELAWSLEMGLMEELGLMLGCCGWNWCWGVVVGIGVEV
jgi:hypothetical protein